jgi:hypothetical protein
VISTPQQAVFPGSPRPVAPATRPISSTPH